MRAFQKFSFILVLVVAGSVYGQSGSFDLLIESAEPVNTDLHNGDWAKFKVMVKNAGQSELHDIDLDIYKNETQAPVAGKRGQASHLISRIEPGESVRVDFYYRVYSGTYQVYFQVDPAGRLSETDENNNVSGYTLTVSGDRLDDSLEDNDTFSTAKMILDSSSVSYENSLVLKDVDFYKINSPAGRFIKIELRHDYVTSDLDIELYNPGGALVASSKTHSDLERILYKTPSAGNYRLKVLSQGSNTNTYFLSVWRGVLPDYTVQISDVHHILFTDAMEDLFPNVPQYGVDDPEAVKYLMTATLTVTDRNLADMHEESPNFTPFYVDLFFNRTIKPAVGDVGEFYRQISKNDFLETYVVDTRDNETATRWTNQASKQIAIVVGSGVYTLGPIVDTGDEVPESSESNNVGAMLYHKVSSGSGVITDNDIFEPASDTYPGALLSAGRYENLMAWDGYEFYQVNVPAGKRLEFSIDFEHKLGNLDLYRLEGGSQGEVASSASITNRERISVLNTSSSQKTYRFRVGAYPVKESVYVKDDNGDYSWQDIYHFVQNPRYTINVAITDWSDTDASVKWISYSPQTLDQGSNMVASVLVENRGVEPLESLNLDFYRLDANESAPAAGDFTNDSVTIDLLLPGEVREEKFTLPVSVGRYSLYAIVDPNHAISESNEENNFSGPVTYSVYGGDSDDSLESHTMSVGGQNVLVENDDFLQAAPIPSGTHVNLKGFDDDWYVFQVAPGSQLTATASFNSAAGDIDLSLHKKIEVVTNPETQETALIAGLVRFGGTLGDYESVSYFNDSASAENIYIRVHPKASNSYNLELLEIAGRQNQYPDLVIDSVVTTPASPVGGDLITTTVALKNAGDWITTADVTLDLYHSTIPRVGNYGDLFLLVPAGMAPGEVRYYTFEYSLNGGGYALYLFADPDNSLPESVETNNLYGPFDLQVTGGSNGNLSVSNVAAALSGNTASISFSMPNTTLKTDFYIKIRLTDSSADGNVLYEWTKWYQTKYNAVGAATNIGYSLPFDAYVPEGPLYVEVIADWGNWIGESNESDNRGVSAALTRIGRPSLSVSTFGAPAETSSTDTVLELFRYGGAGVVSSATTVNASQLGSAFRTVDYPAPYAASTVGLPTGYYFARVYSYGQSTGPYYFAYGKEPLVWSVTGDEVIDTTEGDNSFDTARSVAIDTPVRLSISTRTDEDWFRFVVHALQLDFAVNDNLDNVTARVYRYAGNSSLNLNNISEADLVEVGVLRKSGQSMFYESALSDGIYFVKVTGQGQTYSAVVRNNSVDAAAPNATGAVSADSYEADNTPGGSSLIGYNQRQTRTLYGSSGGDTDWFYFQITGF